MKTKFSLAAALGGTLLATCLVSGSAEATSATVLKNDANPGIVTLVGKKGGGGHKGGKHYGHKGGGKHYGHKGGGKHYGHKGGGKHYAYKGRSHGYYDRYKHYGHYGKYRRYGYYGLPYISYGYGGGCGWLYRNAIATGDPYWWSRYYECTGYYY